MYYLIQKNVFQNPRYDQIFQVVEELGLEYEEVSFLPESKRFNFNTKRKNVFVYGSVKLAKEAKNYKWYPGSFYGGNHEYKNYSKGYGEHLLNTGSELTTFGNPLPWENQESLFIKPSQDAKVFTGKVFKKQEWEDFVYNSLNNSEQNRVSVSTPIQYSKPNHLIKEARVWIIDKKVITSSYYLFHGNVDFEEEVAPEGLEFAQQMANLYNVADAYVLDICLTYEGWKVVEVNCINSAGFYKADVKAIVLALEEYYK